MRSETLRSDSFNQCFGTEAVYLTSQVEPLTAKREEFDVPDGYSVSYADVAEDADGNLSFELTDTHKVKEDKPDKPDEPVKKPDEPVKEPEKETPKKQTKRRVVVPATGDVATFASLAVSGGAAALVLGKAIKKREDR